MRSVRNDVEKMIQGAWEAMWAVDGVAGKREQLAEILEDLHSMVLEPHPGECHGWLASAKERAKEI